MVTAERRAGVTAVQNGAGGMGVVRPGGGASPDPSGSSAGGVCCSAFPSGRRSLSRGARSAGFW